MRHEQFTVGRLYAEKIFDKNGSLLFPGPNPSGGQDYFVDLNTSNAYKDGLSWETACQTIASAITKSNTSIGLTANRWWARRNRIFVCGDGIDEDLTVLPEKCDIIGAGTDLFPFPRINGHHVFATAKAGVRFINLGFICDGNVDLLTFPASSHGLQVLGCHLWPTNGVSAKGLKITSSAGVKILGNKFYCSQADMAKVFATAISLEGVYFPEAEIEGNNITATAGILVAATVTGAGGVISRNVIRATAKAISDLSSTFQVVDNRWMTDIDTTTSTAGYDFNIQLAAGNIQMGVTGLGDSIPFMKIAEG